ncbi:hypothetical protein JQ609_13655 [Bradyrhizobium sp. AUGA SZCCT0169]|uniref:hypothetical protein n=1 Tax=Bradyrhizobium sp. AUGA SZCCT0169 TaxID=2807663 RepID=UPI001BA48669|nr:hypothetical protein [Bradyrhizobium sp. AUGA SZCCT0169]MBR1247965.1 hypothetical protein [Bradyrhizobium sp. AUGA SZCCT0169]
MAAPVVSVGNRSLPSNHWQLYQPWISYSDADGNPAVSYQFFDGGTSATSGYIWTSTNDHWPAGTTIDVPASQLSDVWLRSGSTTGSETMWVRASDGTAWGNWASFTFTTTLNATPVAAIADQSVHVNTWKQVSTVLSYSVADGDAAKKYQFWDSGTGATSGYFWTPTNSHWAANTVIEVSAADLANVWVRAGSTPESETMWVRAFDGSDWGNWDSFTVASTNAKPVAAINDHSLRQGHWANIDNWLSVVDGDNDNITKYQFWDSGTAATSAFFWTPTNSHWAANTTIDVSAADLGNVWIQGGAATGSETLWVRAFDGNEWGNWDSFTLTTTINTAPTATINDHTLNAAQWAQLVNWTTSSDADGDTITQYQLWDGGTAANSAYFSTPANSHWASSTVIDVAASDLANVWIKGGTAGSTETMYIRAFDGTSWGNWDTFTVTTLPNHAPVASINNQTLHVNEWSQIGNLVSYSDADAHPATQYQFWDGGSGANSGYFWTPTNSHWAASTVIDVSPADLSNVWLRGGAATGGETMYIRAFDGIDWGAWHAYVLTTIV